MTRPGLSSVKCAGDPLPYAVEKVIIGHIYHPLSPARFVFHYQPQHRHTTTLTSSPFHLPTAPTYLLLSRLYPSSIHSLTVAILKKPRGSSSPSPPNSLSAPPRPLQAAIYQFTKSPSWIFRFGFGFDHDFSQPIFLSYLSFGPKILIGPLLFLPLPTRLRTPIRWPCIMF